MPGRLENAAFEKQSFLLGCKAFLQSVHNSEAHLGCLRNLS